MQRPKRERRVCPGRNHKELKVLSKDPLLLYCPTCFHYMGDVEGLDDFGTSRPVLPA